jgi:hypothetical protein
LGGGIHAIQASAEWVFDMDGTKTATAELPTARISLPKRVSASRKRPDGAHRQRPRLRLRLRGAGGQKAGGRRRPYRNSGASTNCNSRDASAWASRYSDSRNSGSGTNRGSTGWGSTGWGSSDSLGSSSVGDGGVGNLSERRSQNKDSRNSVSKTTVFPERPQTYQRASVTSTEVCRTSARKKSLRLGKRHHSGGVHISPAVPDSRPIFTNSDWSARSCRFPEPRGKLVAGSAIV